ncbi:GMC family oxidoreductase [Herbihabitans rhizosphaerae]|uniref:GMC family oxidoreductase n=1 Tax=Herbihabitans rhizosphaerae TaxID=1872711 RepID=UPI00102C1B1F|nr:GMC family oxidoreductase N-terminal domain-containing protein [Herbihabitans rhizosphaerae]
MAEFDYVIVGAGPAGCALANRLSADPDVSVLLIEAGDQDTNPMISIPGAAAQLFGDPDAMWFHPTHPFGPAGEPEVWLRGKTLGGSSSVNGMVYNRGSREDYDELERLGNPGWGWDHILAAYKEIEDNPFGASDVRGAGGPLRVSTRTEGDPLLDDVIDAGGELGWQRAEDLNENDDERVGYTMATIRDGLRVSAAGAFLHPVAERDNLTVAVHTTVDRVVIEDGRAVGVLGRQDGEAFEATATREVILAAGALASPKILQLSGVGPAETLREAGVDVVVDSPNVGARMREHRAFQMQVRLTEDLGYNKILSTPEGQQAAMVEYQTSQTGVLAAPAFEIVGFFKTRPDLDRPDAQFQIAPFSIAPREQGKALEIEREPGMMGIGYALRPTSEGSVRITSADPDAPVDIDANYLDTEYDRTTTVAIFRTLRGLFGTGPLAKRVERETLPGPEVDTDQEIQDFALTVGSAGYHAVGTCAMGPNDDDVVDSRLRVRGVANLRVVDASVFPTLVSGNLNGPVSALGWRAADLIIEDA